MHGTGNDFILLDQFPGQSPSGTVPGTVPGTLPDYPEMAKAWCDRHFGIGADGVILILPSKKADFRMRIFNLDGSEAEMCGNGIRCFARLVYEQKLTSKTRFTVETPEGIVEPECLVENGRVTRVRVNMGIPRYGDLHPEKGKNLAMNASDLMKTISLANGEPSFDGATISMGNPHFVIFTDEPKLDCGQYGQILSTHSAHPHQSNVEFVKILASDKIRVDVWERGAGPTLACGSGACASAAAARILKKFPETVHVEMPGGQLLVEWDGRGPIFLTGPAAYVYEGEVSDELLTLAGSRLTGRITAHE